MGRGAVENSLRIANFALLPVRDYMGEQRLKRVKEDLV